MDGGGLGFKSRPVHFMKTVFLAGSRRFSEEIEKLVRLLKDNGIRVETAGKQNKNKSDTLGSEKSALLKAFERIENSDVVYIYSKDGYIGKTVAMEIAYAHAKNKEIISSHSIEEFSAQALVSKVMRPEKLIEYLK